MKFEHTYVFNFENALRGMRNPKNSWDRSDSYYDDSGYYIIGENDMSLAKALIRGGSEHRKFLRQIFVSVDITAPLYWWKQMDTYRVGVTTNSTSTMHKLTAVPITMDCIETDYESPQLNDFIATLENWRQQYVETGDKLYWEMLIRWLPEGWLQKRTVTMNYENLFTMCKQRRTHKLNEWSGLEHPAKANFIGWARTLPYAQEFIFLDEEQAQ